MRDNIVIVMTLVDLTIRRLELEKEAIKVLIENGYPIGDVLGEAGRYVDRTLPFSNY